MSKNRKKASVKRKVTKTKTPELPEEGELHPQLEDDPGAWSDHDSDWILQGRIP